VLDYLHAAVEGRSSVIVDGSDGLTTWVADRLAERLLSTGRSCTRLTKDSSRSDEAVRLGPSATHMVTVADGSGRNPLDGAGWDVVVSLHDRFPEDTDAGRRRADADIVIDLYHPKWPVIRHIATRLMEPTSWYASEARAFFAVRASTWDTKFGTDQPAYTAAVAEAAPTSGATVVDVGCGTGRALQPLREAVGPTGTVIGFDLTPQMLDSARRQARDIHGSLILADALHLPIKDAVVDVVFTAGLISHLPDRMAGLRELARITRPGGRLVLFHPSGRAALAARHGRTLHPDDHLAAGPLRCTAETAGWTLLTYDDPPGRFLAIAQRT
jgi:SAM-dependent methyltransferase